MIASLKMDEYKEFITSVQNDIMKLTDRESGIIKELKAIQGRDDVFMLIPKAAFTISEAERIKKKILKAKENAGTDSKVTLDVLVLTVEDIIKRLSRMQEVLDEVKDSLSMSNALSNEREELNRLTAFAKQLKQTDR